MNQIQIDGLAAGRNEIDLCWVKYRNTKALWQPIIDAIQSICDHKNPDGSSAVVIDFIDDVCLICHAVVSQKDMKGRV